MQKATAPTTSAGRGSTSISAVLALTALASLSTGIFWNGIPFIAEHDYGFREVETLVMFLVVGSLYAAAALRAGWFIARLERWMSPRTLLLAILLLQAGLCAGPVLVEAGWIIWVVTIGTNILAALLWPMIESYLSAGRGGRRLRFAIGLWNVVWTAAVAAALLMMAPLMRGDATNAKYAIVILGGVNMIAAICLRFFRREPLQPGDESAGAEVGPEYLYLLRAARLLLPASYLLVGMIGPLMPYRLASIGVEAALKTPLTATWMIARVVAILVMWRAGFWHGRWGTLLMGGATMTLGFFAMVASPNVATMFIGLAIFGLGQGVVYYAAIYYAMSVGHAEIGAAGTHEGLIGVGYMAGPLLGLAPLLVVGWDRAEATDAQPTIAVMRIALVAGVMLIIGVLALQPYRSALKRRRASSE